MLKIKRSRLLLIAVTLILWLSCSMSGCAHFRKARYLPGNGRIVELKQGEVAPFDGYLMDATYMQGVFEKLGETTQ